MQAAKRASEPSAATPARGGSQPLPSDFTTLEGDSRARAAGSRSARALRQRAERDASLVARGTAPPENARERSLAMSDAPLTGHAQGKESILAP